MKLKKIDKCQCYVILIYGLWTIWKMRNDVVFNKKVPNIMLAVQNISNLANDFNLACNLNSETANEPAASSGLRENWRPPQAGFAKVNIDAGCFEGNYTCWGLIVRDHRGHVQAAATKREKLKCSPTLAEAIGLRWCLQWINDQNLQNVVVEMDAESVVNCILRKLKIAEIDFIIADCLDILFRHFNVSVVYAKRSKNKEAHSLVGIARNLGSLLWFRNVPEPVSSIVLSKLIIGNE